MTAQVGIHLQRFKIHGEITAFIGLHLPCVDPSTWR
jgi:hypothetical protein